jgi:rSAM/selenodomain-associated transferase 1
MPISKKCILLFLRAPEKGRVKTRLAASLGDQATLAFYRTFVEDIMEMLSETGYPVLLYGHPADKISDITSWLGPDNPCRPQTGDTLGKKMANAFSEAFSEGFEQVVLLGSDIPDLPPQIIHEAFGALDKEGAAIGPSLDGGYYLIAFRASSFLPRAFENIPWSTESVLPRTLGVFRAHGKPVHLLPQWQDIDTVEDLKDLDTRHRHGDKAASRTLEYLRQLTASP